MFKAIQEGSLFWRGTQCTPATNSCLLVNSQVPSLWRLLYLPICNVNCLFAVMLTSIEQCRKARQELDMLIGAGCINTMIKHVCMAMGPWDTMGHVCFLGAFSHHPMRSLTIDTSPYLPKQGSNGFGPTRSINGLAAERAEAHCELIGRN